MEDIKPPFTEKEEFEYRYKSILKTHLKNSDCQDYYARNKNYNFSETWFDINWKLSIVTMIEKIKPAAREKNEFGFRHKSKIPAPLGTFGLS